LTVFLATGLFSGDSLGSLPYDIIMAKDSFTLRSYLYLVKRLDWPTSILKFPVAFFNIRILFLEIRWRCLTPQEFYGRAVLNLVLIIISAGYTESDS